MQGTSSTGSATAAQSFAARYIGVTIFLVAVIALFAHAFDKSAAMNDRRRTPEQSLHLLELLGGWPGALLAQPWFRHKSRKLSFRIEFWFCVLASCIALVRLYERLISYLLIL